jgi:hypothetical protein
MSKGPEANFWTTIRKNLPKKSFATRIENKHGGGVPDVHMVLDGVPLWLELKTTKHNGLNLTPHQIAWHMAYFANGGASYFLAKSLTTKQLHLFSGDQGPCLKQHGMGGVEGQIFGDVCSMFMALRPHAARLLARST